MSAGFSETQVELPVRKLAEGLIGQIRTFGPDGPVYQVVQLLDAATARIRILENEEDTEYPVARILNDPPAE